MSMVDQNICMNEGNNIISPSQKQDRWLASHGHFLQKNEIAIFKTIESNIQSMKICLPILA